MEKTENKKALLQFLPALAFGTVALAAVHMLTFTCLVACVYRDNIRGYAPAGLTGLLILGVSSLILLFHLTSVAWRKQHRATPSILGGCLAIPSALFLVAIYTSLLIPFLGHYSWKKDVVVCFIGGVICSVAAFGFHRTWLAKRPDNQSAHETR